MLVGLIVLGFERGTAVMQAGLVAAVVGHCFAVLILPTAMYLYLFAP